MFPHAGPPMYHHPWWGFFGGLLLILLLAALVGVMVWAVLRLTSQGAARSTGQTLAVPAQVRTDTALEHARYRYARGEIDRDQFLLISGDLGAPVSATPPPAPPAAEQPEA